MYLGNNLKGEKIIYDQYSEVLNFLRKEVKWSVLPYFTVLKYTVLTLS